MRRSYINAAIKFTGVEIHEDIDVENSYDPNTNEIFLNTANDSWLGQAVKGVLGRPTYEGFSLAHELGHAVFKKKRLSQNKEFKRLFGKVGEYGGGTLAIFASAFKEGTEEHLTSYGSYDPEEDFADCFAHLCTADTMSVVGFSPKIREKLKFVRSIMEEVKRA